MNERLKKLMIESGAYDYYEINEGVEDDEKPMVKLVELVVRECCTILMDDKEISWADSIRISENIREEFGVEE